LPAGFFVGAFFAGLAVLTLRSRFGCATGSALLPFSVSIVFAH
jgi:hypothetical protein